MHVESDAAQRTGSISALDASCRPYRTVGEASIASSGECMKNPIVGESMNREMGTSQLLMTRQRVVWHDQTTEVEQKRRRHLNTAPESSAAWHGHLRQLYIRSQHSASHDFALPERRLAQRPLAECFFGQALSDLIVALSCQIHPHQRLGRCTSASPKPPAIPVPDFSMTEMRRTFSSYDHPLPLLVRRVSRVIIVCYLR